MLSSDVLTQRLSRSPFTAQRRAVAAGMDPQHAKVLQLQRDAGNRAVTQMVAAQRHEARQRQAAGQVRVQRALTSRARDLGKHQRVLKGTYGKIVRVLADYEGARSAQQKMTYAMTLLGLADTWLKDHSRPTSAREKQQREKVQLLEAECLREMSNHAAQQKYMEGFDKTGPIAPGPQLLPGVAPNGRGYTGKGAAPFDPNQQFGQFGALSSGAKANATAPAKSLAAGRTHDAAATEGAGKAALKLASKYKLTAAEIAAIRTYSFADYAYIIPASANSQKYTKEGLEKSLDPALNPALLDTKTKKNAPLDVGMAFKEGAMHTGMLMQALAKMKPFVGKGYRGERLTEAAFNSRYEVGSVISGAKTESGKPAKGMEYNRFGSASTERSVATKYSQGRGSGDQEINDDQTVSVILELELMNARDISKLSGALKKEDEVLILPGAKFVITAVLDMPWNERKLGNPMANKWAIVRMKQIA